MNPNGTGLVKVGSDLERRKILKEGILQESAKSFFAGYKGTGQNSIIRYVNDKAASAGNTVVFDMRGCLETNAIKGDTTAEGKGVQKQKFSDKVTIHDYRFVVDNGDKFSAKNIDALKLTEHTDSMALLADQWVRTSDQGIFDTLQRAAEFGFKFDGVDADSTFNITNLGKVELGVKAGFGFHEAPAKFGRRTPFKSFKTTHGEQLYVMFIDGFVKQKFLADPESRDILKLADVRGNNNRLLSGIIGKIGNFLLVEAPIFTGTDVEPGVIMPGGATGQDAYYNFSATSVYSAGLRTYILENNRKIWQGTPEYDQKMAAGNLPLYSRCVIAGANALQFAVGMDPDYKFRLYDFDKYSESALEVWVGLKASRLNAENADYKSITVAGYNYGMVFVDVKIGGK